MDSIDGGWRRGDVRSAREHNRRERNGLDGHRDSVRNGGKLGLDLHFKAIWQGCHVIVLKHRERERGREREREREREMKIKR